MRRRLVLQVLASLGLFGLACASSALAQDPRGASGAVPSEPLPNVDPQLVAHAPWLRAPIVKGKPFCADATQETVQQLQDGNRITRDVKSRVCRDAEGRMRQEIERGAFQQVFINDVVERKAWILNPQRQVAHFIVLDEALKELQTSDRIRLWARRLVGQEPGPTPAASVPEAVTLGRQPGGGLELRRNKDEVMSSPPALIGMQAGVQWHERMSTRGPAVVTSLGAKEIEGVRASGRLATWTIHAGAIGNQKPIALTAEVWHSSELEITLLTRHTDPRTGVSTFMLTGIDRRAAAAAQFAVPPDYQIRQRPLNRR